MGAARPLVSLVLLVGGCNLILPLAGHDRAGAPEAGPDGPDAGVDLQCTATLQGLCHPNGLGFACIDGKWQFPPCVDDNCGDPDRDWDHGFCDPQWSECVAGQPGILSCDQYCESIGKKCCDTKKHAEGICAPHERCITSRGYGSDTTPYWGAESWYAPEECADPLSPGVGQHYCNGDNSGPWGDDPVADQRRYRCCCFDN